MTYYAELSEDGTIVQQHTEPVDPPKEWKLLDTAINWAARPHPLAVMKWVDDAPTWIDTRTVEIARREKINEISQACAASILAGFISTALGEEHTYPAKPTDQTNLAGSILDSLIASPGDWVTPFWCADSAGAWDFRMHTAAQIQQVGRDGKAAILAAMTRNEALRAQIMESSIAQIDEIHW